MWPFLLQEKFFGLNRYNDLVVLSSVPQVSCRNYIAPPPTPCECRECAEDAPRSVQMHTGASSAYVPTLSRPCLCFWTLPYSVVFISTYSNPWQGSRTPPGFWPHVCSLFSFVLGGEKSPLTGWLTFSTRKIKRGFSGPLSSSLIFSHKKEQKSRAKFLFQRNFA